MEAERLLREITDFCRKTGVAESTFGRLAVNDGKFVNRLRDGGRITTNTFDASARSSPRERDTLVGSPTRTRTPRGRSRRRRPPRRRTAISASSTTARSTCCS